jgi:hypothetical protein
VRREFRWAESQMAEVMCVWCRTLFVGRDRALYCSRKHGAASRRHPYRRYRLEPVGWLVRELDGGAMT